MGARRVTGRLGTAALALALIPLGASAFAVPDQSVAVAAPRLQVLPVRALPSAPPTAQDDRRLTLPRTRTRAFSTLGMTWLPTQDAEVVEVAVRTRAAGTSRWSRWRSLAVDPAALSGQGERDGTAAMHVGRSDGIEARATVRGGSDPLDLRVDLVDPGPAPPAGSLTPAPAPGPGSARVIPREAWGADPQAQCVPTQAAPPRVVLLSRASTTSDYSRAEAAVVVRGLQAFETLSRGWCDMGAAYVVDRFGRVFTGRAAPGGGAATGRGAPGFDADSLGIAVLAADSTSGPTEAQVTGLVPIIAERLAPAYADPGGTTVLLAGPGSPVHPAGKPVTFQVIGDRGAALSGGRTSGLDERALGALRRRVTAQLHGALVAPTASASELRIGADDELRVTAGVLGSQQWTLVVQDEAGVVVRRLAGTARQSLDASWDLRDGDGTPVAPGRYRLTVAGRADGRDVLPWTTEVRLMAGADHPDEGTPPVPTPEPGALWSPTPGTAWQWQLQGDLDLSVDVPVYDLDGFATSAETIAALRSAGKRSICYLSVGAWEDWRPDAARFPSELLGADNGWPGERWLDIRRIDALAPLLRERIAMCRAKGFDAVEPDNIDGYVNDSGFPLTAGDQLRFNRWLADEVHRQGMSIGLKNDLDQVPALVRHFDFAINEQCFEFSECDRLLPFVRAGKAVLHVEYDVPAERFCGQVPAGFSSMQKRLDLDAWRRPC